MTYPKEFKPETLARIGILQEDLLGTLRRFDTRFMNFPQGLSFSEKYGFFDNSRRYLIIASRSTDGKVNPVYNYNFILTVTSDFSEVNIRVAEEFEAKTKLSLRQAPGELSSLMQGLGLVFFALQRHGNPNQSLEYLASFCL
jgi:hypothetical protein